MAGLKPDTPNMVVRVGQSMEDYSNRHGMLGDPLGLVGGAGQLLQGKFFKKQDGYNTPNPAVLDFLPQAKGVAAAGIIHDAVKHKGVDAVKAFAKDIKGGMSRAEAWAKHGIDHVPGVGFVSETHLEDLKLRPLRDRTPQTEGPRSLRDLSDNPALIDALGLNKSITMKYNEMPISELRAERKMAADVFDSLYPDKKAGRILSTHAGAGHYDTTADALEVVTNHPVNRFSGKGAQHQAAVTLDHELTHASRRDNLLKHEAKFETPYGMSYAEYLNHPEERIAYATGLRRNLSIPARNMTPISTSYKQTEIYPDAVELGKARRLEMQNYVPLGDFPPPPPEIK